MQQEQSQYNRKRLVALGALVLLIIIILLLIWWWFVPKKTPSATPGTPQISDNDRVILPPQVQGPSNPEPSVSQPSAGEAQIINLARNFAERYGSWSTDSTYQNLRDLFPNITSSLKAEFERTIAAGPPQGEFMGIDTKALNVALSDVTATRARAVVTTQRQERSAQALSPARYQEIALTLLKQGEFWYVDSAIWK